MRLAGGLLAVVGVLIVTLAVLALRNGVLAILCRGAWVLGLLLFAIGVGSLFRSARTE